MAIGKVCEWRRIAGEADQVVPVPDGMPSAIQVVSFTTSTATTNAIRADTELVGLWVDADAYWTAAATPTATTAHLPLTARQWFWYRPRSADKIAFVAK